MGTPVVANVLKTGAVVWYAPVGETNPDETSVAYAADWGGNWERLGYTSEPLVMTYESEEMDITTEEAVGPINRFRVRESLMLETKIAELTATYLALAGGDQDTVVETPADTDQKPLEEVGLGGVFVIPQHAWGFEGFRLDSAGTAQPVRVFVHIGTARIGGEVEFSQKSDSYPGIAIQIRALAKTANAAGKKLIEFQRVTGPTS